ncbi:MAG: GPP34 family phosphoprotein, partial [Bacteroidales bacterium]|nr:GPP34 family phosphoprotein [Bacteroidales bacterium]
MKLTLREKLVLLFHHELKDKFSLNDYRFDTTFAGAMLFEMLELKCLNITQGKLIVIGNSKSLSKDLKKVYKKIKSKVKPKKVCYWVALLSENSKKYRKYILKQMSKEKLLTIEKKRYLFFFEKEITHLLIPDLREEIVNDLRAVLMEDKKPTYDEMALICLIDSADVYRL